MGVEAKHLVSNEMRGVTKPYTSDGRGNRVGRMVFTKYTHIEIIRILRNHFAGLGRFYIVFQP